MTRWEATTDLVPWSLESPNRRLWVARCQFKISESKINSIYLFPKLSKGLRQELVARGGDEGKTRGRGYLRSLLREKRGEGEGIREDRYKVNQGDRGEVLG